VRRIEGLYAVTPDEPDTERLVKLVTQVVAGGAAIVQYRNKIASAALREAQAHALASVCRNARVTFIVNDHVDLAISVGADGVHVGREDEEFSRLRARLGKERLIGVSCYNDVARAVQARDAGADYVAFGGFFPSSTKPGTAPSSLSMIAEAKRVIGLPIVAIGGITAENGRLLVQAGADALAVISALFGAEDVRAMAGRFASMFESRSA